MNSDAETIKSQILRFIEARKNEADELGKLLCLVADNQATQFDSYQALLSEQKPIGLQDDLLDINELASRSGIKKSTLYSWSSKGKIKCYKFGGSLRFSWQEVSQWAKAANQQCLPKQKAAANKT
jgi:excisionase family DNA binding protein